MLHSFGHSRWARNIFHTELKRIALFIAQYFPNGNFYDKKYIKSWEILIAIQFVI